MGDLLINNPRLESKVNGLVNDFMRNHDRPRCYEISRHIANGLQEQGFSNPKVKDGFAIYTLDFLVESGLDPHLKDILIKRKKKHEYFFVDHSWCELPKEKTRIDYLPTIILPKGRHGVNKLFLTNIDTQDERAEYFPVGQEFESGGSTFIYIPMAGSKTGPFYLPRIVELIK